MAVLRDEELLSHWHSMGVEARKTSVMPLLTLCTWLRHYSTGQPDSFLSQVSLMFNAELIRHEHPE
jgi:hypothetical protein